MDDQEELITGSFGVEMPEPWRHVLWIDKTIMVEKEEMNVLW